MSQITMDELKHFWMPSGVPCFIADRSDICDIVEGIGFQIYYLLANDIKETKPTPNTTHQAKSYGYGATTYTYNSPANPPPPIITKNTKLFKVVNNFVGRSIAISTDAMPDEFLSINESCEYGMPPIPNVIIDKLDQFFRLVHSQHGTESIVILTYNMNATGSEGWGVLVPDQTNTPAHCKYDADSIAELKPEDVMIVGSVHSHPEMSAYASGTDHADQADFDGLHITYGWQKSQNNGATQYHLELQMSGQNYILKPEDVFEDIAILKDPDPDVVEWSGKVKKVHPPYSTGVPSQITQRQFQGTPQQVIQQTAGDFKNFHSSTPQMQEALLNLKLPADAIVAIEIQLESDNKSSCPCCEYEIDIHDVNSGACTVCDIPLVTSSDSISQMCIKIHDYISKRKISHTSPVYLWGYDDKDTRDFIINITEEYDFHASKYSTSYLDLGNSVVPVTSSHWDYWRDDDDDDDYLFNSLQHATACCNTPMTNAHSQCECPVMLFKEDLVDFDIYVNKIESDIYSYDGNCFNCSYYHTTECPAFYSLVSQFVTDKTKFLLDDSTPKISDCSKFKFFRYEDETLLNQTIDITKE